MNTKLLHRSVDADCFESGDHVLTDDAAAVPLLEDGVEDDDEEAVSHGLLEEDLVVPEVSVAVSVVLERLFDLIHDCDDERVLHVVAFCGLVLGNDFFRFVVLPAKNEVSRRFRSQDVDGNADNQGEQSFK